MTAPDQTNAEVSDERLTLAKDDGADFVLTALGKALGHEQWTQHDGSETWDGDVHATLMHMLRDAGVLDPETDAPLFGTRRSVTSQASEGEGDSGTIHDDESTAAAMERAQRLRERGWKLEAAAERLEQEAHDRAIKRGEHTGTDGI